MMENVMSNTSYLSDIFPLPPFDFNDTSDHNPLDWDLSWPGFEGKKHTEEMKQEQRMLHLGKKRSKQACKNISKSKNLGNHNLAKSYLLISPIGKKIIVPKGMMNVISSKLGLNPNGLRYNASTPKKDGTPRTLKGWICINSKLVC